VGERHVPWDPDRYHQFEKERSAPFFDLLALVERRPALSVIDLGCGTGELTARLADALPGADVTGLDRSPEMLARAQPLARPGLHFEQGDISDIARDIATMRGQWDLIFSNAALQWVEDHNVLIPRLLASVRPGGQLVVQVPSNHTHPTHTLILELASEEPFQSALGGWRRISPVLPIEAYAELLYRHGASQITVFEKVYPHVLPDAGSLADWTSGTALVPYFERLTEDLRTLFIARYRARLAALWPTGPVFYPFRRTLFAAINESGNE
jgi:trans-aconitate 2-methyltransferase